eukprot:1158039-Pelagomonas_calceolata.AAC.2
MQQAGCMKQNLIRSMHTRPLDGGTFRKASFRQLAHDRCTKSCDSVYKHRQPTPMMMVTFAAIHMETC